ncbi:MAG: type II toxin-antitoxin system VapC family toxin [bacterium]
MKKVLFDTNIILDIALKRESFFEDAQKLFILIDEEKITGNITATTITDIYYIAKKEKGHNEAINFIKNLIEVIDVIGINKETILKALASTMKDFEDAIQSSAAEIHQIDLILTRNKNDFTDTTIKVLTPKEFLKD